MTELTSLLHFASNDANSAELRTPGEDDADALERISHRKM